MLAYCGINCQQCIAYKGTVTTDLTLLKKAGESYEHGKYQPEDWVCLGCGSADQKFLSKYCQDCLVRNCAIEKKYQNCAECEEYENCAILHKSIMVAQDDDPEQKLLTRMNLLRKRFLDSK